MIVFHSLILSAGLISFGFACGLVVGVLVAVAFMVVIDQEFKNASRP
jgi:tetrahydromethanopterin S-methyltransferase subunit F